MKRREWARRVVLGLMGLHVLPACRARSDRGEARVALNELLLHVLGIGDLPFDLLSRMDPSADSWKADLYGTVVRHVRRNYERGGSIDYESFFEDVEKGREPAAGFSYALEMMKAEAITAFYTSRVGWRLAGFDGPPVRSTIIHYWMRRTLFPTCNTACHPLLREWNLGQRPPDSLLGSPG